MEAEKKEIIAAGNNRTRWLVIAVVVLTVSVVALTTVTTLMSTGTISVQHANEDNEEATITRSLQTGSEEATVDFYHNNDIELILTKEGALTAKLYRKGIIVTNNVTNGDCYLLRVDLSEADGRQEENRLQTVDNLDIEPKTLMTMRSTRPMNSEELTILPQFVRNYCRANTYWVSEKMEEEAPLQRPKRGWRRISKFINKAIPYVQTAIQIWQTISPLFG